MPEVTGRSKRDVDDYYATTTDLARLICRTVKRDVGPSTPDRILEPGCGAGTFLEAIRETWPKAELHGIEIRPELGLYARTNGFDVTVADVLDAELAQYDLIIGNPPFKHADAFIPLLMRHLEPGGVLAFILRLNYLAGAARYAELWSKHGPARIYPLPKRPGFTRNGHTDATDYMVCVWVDGHRGPAVLAHMDNRRTVNRWATESFPDPRKTSQGRLDADAFNSPRVHPSLSSQ